MVFLVEVIPAGITVAKSATDSQRVNQMCAPQVEEVISVNVYMYDLRNTAVMQS